jgi:SAM-dependent methyltransferase
MMFNKMCELDDWDDPVLREAIRLLQPQMTRACPDYPQGREHRKAWEYAQLIAGLRVLGALRPEDMLLGVGAGHEWPLYEFTKHVRWVFATDIYGAGDFTGQESDSRMLRDPDHFALDSYNRNRLVVQWMDARDLRFEPDTFDAVFSLSSIEHFGGMEGARTALREMHRVLKPDGVLMLATECIANGQDHLSIAGLELFTPRTLTELLESVPQLTPVEEIRFTVGPRTFEHVVSLEQAVADSHKGHTDYPHILLELSGRIYTSISVFLRKTA